MTDWRLFIRGLAEEIDGLAAPSERDDMLRGIGRRMARMMPLAPVQTLAALELEVNDALSAAGWGRAEMEVIEGDRVLRIVHTGLPRVGSLGAPAGQWLSAVLEGLYDAWFAQQPGSKPALQSRRRPGGTGSGLVLDYARSA